MTNTATTLEAVTEFVAWINTEADIPEGYVYEVGTPGVKNVRIVMKARGDRGGSVHAFVELATGNLLKAAGWKAPAKGVRGNVVTDLDEIKARFTWSGGYLYIR
jgi:hypothetical protein